MLTAALLAAKCRNLLITLTRKKSARRNTCYIVHTELYTYIREHPPVKHAPVPHDCKVRRKDVYVVGVLCVLFCLQTGQESIDNLHNTQTDNIRRESRHKDASFYAPHLVPAGTAKARTSYGNSVCRSVCPSVTTRWYTKPRWDRDSGSSPYHRLESLVSYEVMWCQWVKRFPLNDGIKEGYAP